MIEQKAQAAKSVAEGLGFAAVGLSSPWWLSEFHLWIGIILAIGGVLLMLLRVAIAWREWKEWKEWKEWRELRRK